MRNGRRTDVRAATLVVAVALAGCAARGPEAAGTLTEVPPYTEADVRFMQHMIPHHGQALVMADLVPTRAGREDLRLMAERVEVSQRDEIATMQRWLRERGEAVPDPLDLEHVHMPGMLTEEEMERLAAARGPEFDRLFLEFMIRHHQGALRMVEELLASPGAAQSPEVYQIASEIDADQRMEIQRMGFLLSRMRQADPGAGSP